MSLDAPVQPLRCDHPDCTLPVGGTCARAAEFLEPLATCPSLVREPQPLSPDLAAPLQNAEGGAPTPWRGAALSYQEAHALMGRSMAHVVAVLGPTDVGKTSLLAALFGMLSNGRRASLPYRFATSRSLRGWYDLALRAQQGRSVPRTSRSDSTTFLHLGLRPEKLNDDRLVDVLLSDVSGEWVAEWVRKTDSAAAEHLRFLDRANAHVVVIDAAERLNNKSNKGDSQSARLLQRIAQHNRDCQAVVAIVLAKFDQVAGTVTVPDDPLNRDGWGQLGRRSARTWKAIERLRDSGARVGIFATSAFPCSWEEAPPVEVVTPFAWVLQQLDHKEVWAPPVSPPQPGCHPFAAMHRWAEAS